MKLIFSMIFLKKIQKTFKLVRAGASMKNNIPTSHHLI